MILSLNPGMALIVAAALLLAAPRGVGGAIMLAAALAAGAMMFAPAFGEHMSFAQLGLTVAPFRLDAASQTFGLAVTIMAALLALYGWRDAGRIERAAASGLAGGALAAIFAGDLISFVAASSFLGLAAAVLALRGNAPGAKAAGVRLLLWQAAAGAIAASGVGLIWAETGAAAFERLSVKAPGGALIFAAMLIQAGAVGAHVWLKDAPARASAFGGAALLTLATPAAIYALTRSFSGEPILVWIGAATGVIGLMMAAAAPQPRQALCYGLIGQNGLILAAIGVGAPLALAGAAALAFGLVLAVGLAAMTLGVGLSLARPTAQAPVTTALALFAAAALFAAPGTAGFIGMTLLLDALSHEPWLGLFALALATIAGAAAHGGWRAPMQVFFAPPAASAPDGAPPAYPAMLAMVIAGFLIVAIGLSPSWLLGLLPQGAASHPVYLIETVGPHVQIICAALAAFGLFALARLVAPAGGGQLLDLDWLARSAGPLAAGLAAAVLAGIYARAARAWSAGAKASAAIAERTARLVNGRDYEQASVALFALFCAFALVGGLLIAAS
jgi:multicomponent Na+:H+ antiporter subunit D